MPVKPYKFKLPIDRQVSIPNILVRQGDKGGNKLTALLTFEGRPFDISGATYAKYTVLKEDNTVVAGADAFIENYGNGAVSFVLSEQAIVYPGTVFCQVEVYTGLDRITSATFAYTVIEDLANLGDPASSSEYPILQQLLIDVAALETNVEAAESVRVTAENNRATAEQGRVTAENNRAISEINRVNAETARVLEEQGRSNAESARVIAENNRTAAETTRQDNENTRQTKETARQAVINALMVHENYNPGKIYDFLNHVTYQGSTYIALVDGLQGVTPGTDPLKWHLEAQKGVDGTGTGDMTKLEYDSDGDGIVNSADYAAEAGYAPTNAHKNNHATGGTDALTPDDIGAETPSGAQAKVDALAGVGNTTTVKALADAQASHEAEYKTHLNAWIPRSFTKHGSPITTYPTGVDQLVFPCVLKVSEFLSNPIDDYYMWCAPHDDPGGIYLFTSPEPEGPWTLYGSGPILTREDVGATGHISSPHAVWVKEENRFYFYFHCKGKEVDPIVQPTYLAFTPDGVSNFTLYSNDPVIPLGTEQGDNDARGASYARVVRLGALWIAFYQGDHKYPSSGDENCNIAYSEDGKKWYKSLDNPIIGVDEGETAGAYLPTPFILGDICYLFYATIVNDLAVIKLAQYDQDYGVRKITTVLEPSSGAWDDTRASYPYPYVENNKLYLYYVGNNVSTSVNDNISVAVGVF